jgi:glycosyltransferase involved in cell wall biosynthesis
MRATLGHEGGGPVRRFRPADVRALLAAARPCAAPPATARQPRVLLAGKLLALSAPGGGETQLAAMARWLPRVGVEARLWRPWEDRLAEADCLHLFGTLAEHLPLVAEARRLGVRVAISPIAWYDLASLWHEPRPLPRRLAGCARLFARTACPLLRSWRRTLYHSADLLLPNSQAEAVQLIRQFGVPPERIHVVPNGAEERFAEASPQPFAQRAGGRGFVLCPGRIEPRKNQLGLLRALRGSGVPIVVLGDAVPGHERYLDRCRRVADDAVRFLPRVAHDDPLLASAYAACGCLAVCSWFETPGLVALEAALQGVPLVLPAPGASREYFGGFAQYVHPRDERGIRRAVLAARERPRSPALARLARRLYTWRAAAEATREAYESLLPDARCAA